MNSGQQFHPNPIGEKRYQISTAKIDNKPDIDNIITKNIKNA